jgi:hypothetical protein
MPKRWAGAIRELSALDRMDMALEALRAGCRQPHMHVMSGRDPEIPVDAHAICANCGIVMIERGIAAVLPSWKQAQLRALHAIGWVYLLPAGERHAVAPWYEPVVG